MRPAIFAIILTASLFSVLTAARVKEPAADFCTLLPVSYLEKVYEQPFSPVEKSTPPPAASNVSSAVECDYNSKKRASENRLHRF